jgi:hypothetical protein
MISGLGPAELGSFSRQSLVAPPGRLPDRQRWVRFRRPPADASACHSGRWVRFLRFLTFAAPDHLLSSDRAGAVRGTIRGGLRDIRPPALPAFRIKDCPGPDRSAPANPSTELTRIARTTINRKKAWHTTDQTQAMSARFWDDPE